MESSLKRKEPYLTKGMKMAHESFIKSVEKEVRAWVGDDPLCVVAITPDGPFYAKQLAEHLKKYIRDVGYAELDGERLRDSGELVLSDTSGIELGGKKVLLVDNDIITGYTYRMAKETIKTKFVKLKDIKIAVLEDRVGLADFAYKTDKDWRFCNLGEEIYKSHEKELLEKYEGQWAVIDVEGQNIAGIGKTDIEAVQRAREKAGYKRFYIRIITEEPALE